MCTAASWRAPEHYFGRTLDYDFSYGDEVTVTPRRRPIKLRHLPELREHFAMIGMAFVVGGTPLYYDGVNEKGLCVAGLNFVGNAFYPKAGEEGGVAQFEFIPWLLGSFSTVGEVRKALSETRIVDTPFNDKLPTASTHWLVADDKDCIVVESMRDGIHIHDDPAGVLTNNPPFEYQRFNLNNYMHVAPGDPVNRFSEKLPLERYSRGQGGLGLPGDLSSMSRFVRAAFVRANSLPGEGELGRVSQFFHILGSVDQQRGCCKVGDGYEITLYTSCMDAARGIYYYTTYDNHQISAVDMRRVDLDGDEITRYPVITGEHINYQN